MGSGLATCTLPVALWITVLCYFPATHETECQLPIGRFLLWTLNGNEAIILGFFL